MVQRIGVDGSAGGGWPIRDGKPVGISVTASATVVVALRDPFKLDVYEPDGMRIREIALVPPISSPHHAALLSPNRYLVGYGDGKGKSGLCVVDENGAVLRSVSTRTRPLRHFAVDKLGFVLVADSEHSCIEMLASRDGFSYVRDAVPYVVGVKSPVAMCFDEKFQQLFVGEGSGECRVVAFSVDYSHMA